MSGRALLIGASDYGEGFASLPAVKQDIQLMKRELENRGYSVQISSDETVSNATSLDREISSFCESMTEGVNIIYFSGHGFAADQRDWIIPAKVSRKEAHTSSNQRISTDISQYVKNSRTGVALFIIDACRDSSGFMTTKGPDTSNQWGHGKIDLPESKLIRFFGCSQGEVCHVVQSGDEGHDVSVFTLALTRALANKSQNDTLNKLRDATIELCDSIAQTANPKLRRQIPCFDISGDIGTDTIKLLDKPVFSHAETSTAESSQPQWTSFQAERLHCIVIESEHADNDDSTEKLSVKIEDVFLKSGSEIWKSFRQFWNGRRMIDGSVRTVPDTFRHVNAPRTVLSVLSVFKSRETLAAVIKLIVQADLAFFDLTRFEPGVMFLLGIRAATRRGVTICSHGHGWRVGQELDTPFNLNDLQIFSHSESGFTEGADPVIDRLVKGIQTGFRQLLKQPNYLDLPAYDSLRELGSGIESSGTISWKELVLVLCSFRPPHYKAWNYIRRGILKALQDQGLQEPQVCRLIDLRSPQLVSQSLYEYIRRVSACVMDWSLFSPSSFLELGVRLAVSPWGALQIIEERYLPGGKHAIHIRTQAGTDEWELKQVALMQTLFGPVSYRVGNNTSFNDLIDTLVARMPFDEDNPDYNWIFRTVQESIEAVSISCDAVHEALRQTADSLSDSGSKQQRFETSQILFSAGKNMKLDREQAALEHRIAAWFYLEYRIKAGTLPPDDARYKLYYDLGQTAVASLYDSEEEKDFKLAEDILSKLERK